MNISENKDIKKTQEILMGILKAFDQVCRDNDIEYFLAGGTTLGAVRHEGFLPWDDDIDLYMKNSVWEANREIIRDNLPEKYSLVCDEFDKYYDNPVIRIVDNETTQISRSRVADKTAHGIQIDIFILDPIPDDKEELELYKENFWVYCELKTPTMILANQRVPVTDGMERKYKEYRNKVDSEGREIVLKELEDKLFNYNEADCTNYHLRWGGYWVVAPIAAFDKATYTLFEGEMLPVPVGYPDVMYGEYGNTWMMIPNASEIWDHDTVQSEEIPYEKYDEIIAKKIDLDDYRIVQAKNKEYKIERLFLDTKLRKYYIAHKDAMAKAVLKQDGGTKKYIAMQKALFKEHHLVNLDDEILEKILRETIINGDLDFARGIESFYLGNSESIKDMLNDVKEIRKIVFSYYTGDCDEYINRAIEIEQKYKGQINIIEFICQTQAKQGNIDVPLEKLVSDSIAIYGSRPRLMKVSGDIEMSQGRTESAKAIYEQILETSRDGMVNLEIKKILREELL